MLISLARVIQASVAYKNPISSQFFFFLALYHLEESSTVTLESKEHRDSRNLGLP